MIDSVPPDPQGSESDSSVSPKLNASSAPQKVEVVVESPSSQGEINITAELAIFVLRVLVSVMMIHHGLEKFADLQGFSEFVIAKYFSFLPGNPMVWTVIAATTQILCPVGLALGLFARVSALGLLSTMLFAIPFHLLDTGLEGFPLAVVENHNYAFELSAIYAGIFFYFVCAGPGRLSAFRKTNRITYYPRNTD